MVNSELAQILLRKAHEDLAALGGMLDERVFANDIFGLHAQQAVEKAAKAMLLSVGGEAPHHHDLRVFLADLESRQHIVPLAWRDLLDLNPYAVRWRYAEHDGTELLNRLAVLGRVGAFVARADALVLPSGMA